MEYFGAIVLIVLTTSCTGLELGIPGDSTRTVKAGTKMNLTCNVDKGLPVILEYNFQWIHVSKANPAKPVETILTIQESLQDGASPKYFGIDVKWEKMMCHFTLMFKLVLPKSDGFYKCKAIPQKDPSLDIMEKEIRVIVVNDVESIAMEFDGEESITEEVSTGLEREEGEYGVTCTATGFNPDPDPSGATLEMYLGNEKVETTFTVMLDVPASEAAGAPRYTASATATNLYLKSEHSGLLLECRAQAEFQGSHALVASVPLTIIVLEPVITCDKNVSAKPGDTFVKITCSVIHDNIDIERYAWEIGNGVEIIKPQGTSKEFNEMIVQEIDDITTNVTLDLYQVDEWHFDTYYYLDVFTKSGQNFRHSVQLFNEDVTPSSATKTTAVFVLCALCVAVNFFSP